MLIVSRIIVLISASVTLPLPRIFASWLAIDRIILQMPLLVPSFLIITTLTLLIERYILLVNLDY